MSSCFIFFPGLPSKPVHRKSNNILNCIPQKGDWKGGDEVVLIMSNSIQQKGMYWSAA